MHIFNLFGFSCFAEFHLADSSSHIYLFHGLLGLTDICCLGTIINKDCSLSGLPFELAMPGTEAPAFSREHSS
jgi:hypothetical protein